MKNKKSKKVKYKKTRKIPKYISMPEAIAKIRTYFSSDTYARFYGNYTSRLGKHRRFSFQVKLNPEDNKYRIITAICGRLLDETIPFHSPGQVFSVDNILNYAEWIPIRRLEKYKVGMRYD
jgi:hypothetical protein